jgi:hypothetical protein
MYQKHWTTQWISKLKNDERFAHLRFKRLFKGYPPFEIEEDLIDFVDDQEFNRIEENRIPLFIGSQFGITPRINEIQEFFNGKKYLAILGKSLLSGTVSGLTIYQIEEGDKAFRFRKVAYFGN